MGKRIRLALTYMVIMALLSGCALWPREVVLPQGTTTIVALTELTAPASGDDLIINDVSATNATKRIDVGNLYTNVDLDIGTGDLTVGGASDLGGNISSGTGVVTFTEGIEIDLASGDPGIVFDTQGADKFTLGVDDSDSDGFKISAGGALGTNDRLLIDSSGNAYVQYPDDRAYLGLRRVDSSPSAADTVGVLDFIEEDDGGTYTAYAAIHAKTVTVADGSEDGLLQFYTVGGGTLSERLTIDEAGNLSSSQGGITITDSLHVTGTVDFDSSFNLDGAATLNSTLDVRGDISDGAGDVTVADAFNVTGAVDLDSTLNVDSNSTLRGTLDAYGNISSSEGGITLSDTVNATGAVDFDSTLNVDSNTTLRGTADIYGNISSSEGGITITDSLDVRGPAIVSIAGAPTPIPVLTTSGLEVALGSNSLVTIGESAAANANPAMTMYRTSGGARSGRGVRLWSDISGNLYLESGSSAAYGSESYVGTMTIGNTGNTEITGTLAVTGAVTLRSTLDVRGDISDGAGDVIIDDALNVTGAVDLDSTLNVAGNISSDAGAVTVTDSLVVSNTVYISDTANAGMTLGLTINQQANDDEILALKSSDVAHGMTGLAETDTFARVFKRSAGEGGLELHAYSEGFGALRLYGTVGTDNITKTTAAIGAVELSASRASGASHINPGADANLVVMKAGDSTARFIFDAEGTMHQITADNDLDLLSLSGTTGTPTLSWDESDDEFDFNKGINATGDLTVTAEVQVGTFLNVSEQGAQTITDGTVGITCTGTYHPITSGGNVGNTMSVTGYTAGDLCILINEAATTITITDTGTTMLTGNAALGQYDTLTIIFDGTNWIELAQANN